jgi:two-component system sensor histidine kinase PilS (NtrC family)
MDAIPEDCGEAEKGHDALTWKPLRLLTFYRLILAGVLLVLYLGLANNSSLGDTHRALYTLTCLLYVGFSLVAGFMARLRRPGYELQTLLQILLDIAATTLLLHASGGPASGMGILLIITVAAGSLLMPGRMAFLFAAVATLAVLGEQVYSTFFAGVPRDGGYTQSGLLGAVLFATAGLTYLMAHRIRVSEALAHRRGVDVANLARLNTHIVQRLQAGILVTDHRDGIRVINETARRLLGIQGESEGRALAQMAPALYEKLMQWRRSPEKESDLLRSAGEGIGILPKFTRLGTADGTGALIFLEDTAAMARQAQQMKLASLGRLTASIAHEIRNPLGAISHAAQLLNESESLGADDRRLMAIIREHTRRVNTVIENVLQLSRPGKSVPQRIPLHPWLERFRDEFIHSGHCTAQQIAVTVNPADIEVYMDPSQLHQVMWNLCHNALHHARPADMMPVKLSILCSQEDSRHASHIDIIDNGTGIEPETAEQIFEPFYTSKSVGTGLGLYISREICESNQARLSYQRTPGGGSCFRITFPYKQGLPLPAIAS